MNMGALVCRGGVYEPSRRALVDADESYTFDEVDLLSSRFAAWLVSKGLRRGDRIAFCAPKTAALVVAVIGCLKAGGIYVPMDPKLPDERLLYILEDMAPRFMVCPAALYRRIARPLSDPPTPVEADDLGRLLRSLSGTGLEASPTRDDDIAYCIYTSGSTGKPKGVLIEHGSVTHLFPAMADVMPITPSSRCMNTSPLYFDVHVMDLFFPLHQGATVHLQGSPLIGAALLRTIERERITHFTAVGPVMTLMTESDGFDTRDLSSLERIMTGAEIINVNTMQKWLARVPGLSVVNGYGPTEATVICTAYVIDKVEPDRTELYPIGRAMQGTEVLLVDDGQVVTEVDRPGELLIAGPQVMQGYWKDEKNTNEKVVTVAGRRCYRSGDICKWMADGNLYFMGRADEQVKLSGFRIDLSEIKQVLDGAKNVREGQPILLTHPSLGKVIAACFTCERDDPDGPDGEAFASLQATLKHSLPYYMVPSLFFWFEEFPKLPSGKTDKVQLLKTVTAQVAADGKASTRFVLRNAGTAS